MPCVYSIQFQPQLIIATFCVVNFFRYWNICNEKGIIDEDETIFYCIEKAFLEVEQGNFYSNFLGVAGDHDEIAVNPAVDTNSLQASIWKNNIVNQMWEAYLNYFSSHM